MKLRTFRANSMADALAAVKSDLGPDAVILHTRTVKSGGFLGLWRRTVVEVTASDEAPTPRKRAADSARPTPPDRAETARQSPRPLDFDPPQPPPRTPVRAATAAAAYSRIAPTPPPRPAATEEAVTVQPAAVSAATTPARSQPSAPAPPVAVMRVRERASAAEPASPPPRAAAQPEAAPPHADIRREIADIKLLVSQVLQAAVSSPGGGPMLGATPDALFAEYLRLLESQVSREIADRIVGAVRDELHAGELSDPTIVRTAVLRHLSGMIQVAEPSRLPSRERDRAASPTGEKSPFVIALVGPTGVGKTTTIAKLAATYKLRQGRSVGLITSDTYRIAAVDQLRTYADIIGLPLKVVQSPAEMAAAVHAMSALDVVLIDSAGRSQNNTDRIADLAEFIAAADPDETHLVLSSSAAPEVMFSAAEAFSVVRPNRVILTKLDEAVHFGVVVNIMQKLSTRLSFVTTGQEVPDHIEPGSAERLARLILDRRDTRTATVPHAPGAPAEVAQA